MWFLGSTALVLCLFAASVLLGEALLRLSGLRGPGTPERSCLAAVLGTAALILAAGWLSWAGTPMRGWGPALVALLLFAALGVIRRRPAEPGAGGEAWKLVALLLAPPVICALWPVLRDGAIVPYGDTIPSISLGEFLQDHGFREAARRDWHSPLAGVANLFHRVGLRMGVHYLLGLVQSWAPGASSIEVFPAVAAWGAALVSATCFLIGRWLVRAGRGVATAAAVAATTGLGTAAFSVHWGVMNQLYGMSLLFAYLVLLQRLFSGKRSAGACVLPSGVLLAALVSAYSEMLPFAAAIAAAAWLWCAARRRRADGLVGAFAAAGLAALLANVELLRAARALRAQLGANPGGHVGYTDWQFLASWIGTYPGPNDTPLWSRESALHPRLFAVLLASGPAVALLAAARLAARGRARRASPVLAGAALVFAALWCKFRWFTPNPWIPGATGHTWNLSKLALYALPLSAALLATGFKSGRWAPRAFAWGVAAMFVLLLPVHDRFSRDRVDLVRAATGEWRRPLGAYEALAAELRARTNGAPVRIAMPAEDASGALHVETAAYYLTLAKQPFSVSGWHNGGSVYFGQNEGYAFTDDPRPPALTLLPAMHLLAGGGEPLPGGFVIAPVGPLADAAFEGGWSLREADTEGRWHRWAAGGAAIRLRASAVGAIRISGSYVCARADQRIAIAAGDRPVGALECAGAGNQVLAIGPLCLPAGETRLVFSPDAAPVRLGADPRPLSFMVADLKFTPAPGDCRSALPSLR